MFATPRILTQRRRQNLEERAEELGFKLRQLFDGAAVAELLVAALSGAKSCWACSPRRRLSPRFPDEPPLAWWGAGRPRRGFRLAGGVTGDGVVVGQPGSGKTAVLRHLAGSGWGLFVTSLDRAAISDALRTRSPERVIIVDAHAHPETLRDLIQLRDTSGSGFAIIAATWPGSAAEILQELRAPHASVRELRLLTRDEMVQVVTACGVTGPRELVAEIVSQAGGRAGLAATLCQLCVAENANGLALVDALARDSRVTFSRLVGQDALTMLAGLALSGEQGGRLGPVAKALGIGLSEASTAAAKLAAGGVLRELSNGSLVVAPSRLGQALVRDILFAPGSVDLLTELLNVADVTGAAETLIAAQMLGGHIPDDVILNQLQLAEDPAWIAFAECGEWQARLVIDRRPELVISASRAGLRLAPSTYIPALLAAAVGDLREQHSSPDHPLRLLGDWVGHGRPGSDGITRRKLLLRAATRWLREGGDPVTFGAAGAHVLNPGFELLESDPGAGNTITMTSGLLTKSELRQLAAMWEQVVEALRPCRW